ILLALHNYHDANRAFPAAVFDRDGQPLLSWRVLILPLLDEGKLFSEFHLNEPWDSPHNKELIDKIPNVYRSFEPGSPGGGKTTILGVAGDHGFFRGKTGTKITDITDGTSSTIAIVDVRPAAAVVWTRPDDFNADGGIETIRRTLFPDGRDGCWV